MPSDILPGMKFRGFPAHFDNRTSNIVHTVAGKKNLRRINIVVTAQTLHHLEAMAAANGWGEKDLGRVVDKLIRTALHGRSEAKDV